MKLGWNAIVKDEAAVIGRCLNSLLPHIDCGIVVDTGSTDGTPELIKGMFAAASKPVEVVGSPFKNFEQARNMALRVARASQLPWDYLLLSDADMELQVQRPDWLSGLNGGGAYDMRQSAGTVAYYNRRLVNRTATGQYVGVTHEFLDIPTAGVIDGAIFIDHADGSNRPGKFERDIALLEEALETETRPGLVERYTFYLAQSYFDAGNWRKAAALYRQRAAMGGFHEERWNAQLHYAHCLDNMGDHVAFFWEMMRAYQMHPSRAEVLYDLAKYFRVRGDNSASLVFSEAGMELPRPNDLLFVNDYVYEIGLKEEFAICAYYDERKRARGGKICDELSLKGVQSARQNQYWYLRPLKERMPSFEAQQLFIKVPLKYHATNPSVLLTESGLLTLVRTVNYTITPEGRYLVDGAEISDEHPIDTRNFLVRRYNDFQEMMLPETWGDPQYRMVRGLEDSRLFRWNGNLWTLSACRELNREGLAEQVLARLSPEGYCDDWKVIRPTERRHEKNWMPWVKDGELRFVYRLGEIIDIEGKTIAKHPCYFDTSCISGGSQVIQALGAWLCLVHEARTIPGRPHNRYYQHRLVMLSPHGKVQRISPPFFFADRQIEFAAGLAYDAAAKKLIMSYGVRDCEAWVATVDVGEAFRFLEWAE